MISPMHTASAQPLNEAPVLHNSHIYVLDFSNKNTQEYDLSFYAKREGNGSISTNFPVRYPAAVN